MGSRKRRHEALSQAAWLAIFVESFPLLRTVYRYIRIDLESQLHSRALDAKHRDFEQAMKTIRTADHHNFPALP